MQACCEIGGASRCCRDSYQWDVQPVVKRIVTSLQRRKYAVWVDIQCMKGSVMDAMSEAIDGAELMLLGVSLKYKESANWCALQSAAVYACGHA